MTVAGNELTTTASLGVAIATAASEVFDLMREADTALYRAKDEGRDRYSLYNEDLRREVTERLALEEQLRPALERGELTLWYQPEIDLATGTITAVEALLRWHHPSGEVYAADRFIEVAEDTGLILDIGDWVLREAADQAAAWARLDPDHPLVVRVNLSALQLGEVGLVAAIDEALTASGVDASLLCVETTETALLRGGSTVNANLQPQTFSNRHPERFPSPLGQRFRDRDSTESEAAKTQHSGSTVRQECEPFVHRVGFAVKFQGRVVGQSGILGHLARDQVRINRVGFGLGSNRHRSIEASPQTH